MQIIRMSVVGLIWVWLIACDTTPIADREEAEDFAEKFVASFQQQDYEAIYDMMNPLERTDKDRFIDENRALSNLVGQIQTFQLSSHGAKYNSDGITYGLFFRAKTDGDGAFKTQDIMIEILFKKYDDNFVLSEYFFSEKKR